MSSEPLSGDFDSLEVTSSCTTRQSRPKTPLSPFRSCPRLASVPGNLGSCHLRIRDNARVAGARRVVLRAGGNHTDSAARRTRGRRSPCRSRTEAPRVEGIAFRPSAPRGPNTGKGLLHTGLVASRTSYLRLAQRGPAAYGPGRRGGHALRSSPCI